MAREGDAWSRLENVCAAHLEGLLEDSDYGQVVHRVPTTHPKWAGAAGCIARRSTQRSFAQAVIHALPLPARTDRRVLKLTPCSAR